MQLLCGKGQGDADEEIEEELMRWAYRDGSGNCDWYCERVWGTISHQHKLRSEFHQRCNNNVKLLEKYRERRVKFLAERKKGTCCDARKRQGAKNVQLQKTQRTKLRFIARPEALYPLDMYRRKFVHLKANKANGHFKK